MNMEKRDFDKEADSWDEQPVRVRLAQDIAHAIAEQIELRPEMDVMDFGCGTGLLTLQVQPSVRSVTGVDSSQGMLGILNSKIAEQKLDNVNTVLLDPDDGGSLTGKYDLVISSMTLHHVKEIAPLLKQFHDILTPGGHLCIADLDLEGGRFHGDNTGVFHFGFDRVELCRAFSAAGFACVRNSDAAEIMKPDADGETQRFTVFLMAGQKCAEKM